MGRVDDLAAEMARSRIVRAEKSRWNAKQAHRVRAVVPAEQARLAVMTPQMAEEARRAAIKARFMADWERQCAEEAAAYRRARGVE